MSRRQLHLNVNILNSGFHPAAWRMQASDPGAFLDVQHYVRLAQKAERGALDAVFLADTPSFADRPEYRPYQALEPTIVLAMVAAGTERIGLIATASTTYNDPYNLARRFASLDLASRGRVGWNVVTTADPSASRNFGADDVTIHRDRYERAAEFTDVVRALWGSWDEDVLVADKASGQFIDVKRVQPINHVGVHFKVRGPLNVSRSPQGWPVIVQAGGSDDGRTLAARHAEAIFSIAQTEEDGTAFGRDIRARAKSFGRGGEIVILPGLATMLASTEAEVKRREQELWELLPKEYAIGRLAGLLQIDPKRLRLDDAFPTDLPIPPNGMQSFAAAALQTARRRGLTVREVLRELGGGTGHRLFVGTPEALADDMERWLYAGAADGFNLMPDVFPDGLDILVDEVVPILRRKGIFRREYSGRTLREHFGLSRAGERGAALALAGDD